MKSGYSYLVDFNKTIPVYMKSGYSSLLDGNILDLSLTPTRPIIRSQLVVEWNLYKRGLITNIIRILIVTRLSKINSTAAAHHSNSWICKCCVSPVSPGQPSSSSSGWNWCFFPWPEQQLDAIHGLHIFRSFMGQRVSQQQYWQCRVRFTYGFEPRLYTKT